MADKGPFLTSCIIFFLSIGAAIFQILEEPNWESAKNKYVLHKENILKSYACLTSKDLDEILEVASEAAGQGVSIGGQRHRNPWDWSNSVVFAATIVTTIGYGNVAPKTQGGRLFCIFYGLCGIPLCLVWLSELGSFFGDRAKRLSEVLLRKGLSVKKIQLTCTALFLLWGLLLHLVIPPFVFMSMEGWSYLEGLYFSFITLTTVGFGDYVAGVNPDVEYPRLYRILAEIWIYMGLAWLSLFFSWNVNMVVEAHKVLKRRRHRQRLLDDEEPEPVEDRPTPNINPTVIDIFSFLEQKDDDYSTVIKGIGLTAKRRKSADSINRSKSCSDILANTIQKLDHSPRHRRMISISEVFMNVTAKPDKDEQEQHQPRTLDSCGPSEPAECVGPENVESEGSCAFDPDNLCITFTVPTKDTTEEGNIPPASGASGGTRFEISKVVEEDLVVNEDDKG